MATQTTPRMMRPAVILQTAKKEIGTKEYPANSNKTKYGKWFGLDGLAWCGQFVSWVYAQSGFPLPSIGYLKGFAGCQTAHAFFVKNNWITNDPRPGDIVLYDWNSDGRYDHTGIFIGWIDTRKGTFEAVEGNTSLTNQSNGGEVMLRQRNKKVAIFAHPEL